MTREGFELAAIFSLAVVVCFIWIASGIYVILWHTGFGLYTAFVTGTIVGTGFGYRLRVLISPSEPR